MGSVFRSSAGDPGRTPEPLPQLRRPSAQDHSRVNICTPKTDSELRDLGFTKLVRRDDGVYENVTARPGESRYMSRNDPRSVPKLDKIIRD